MSIVTKETRELSCILTEKEVADLSQFMAAKVQEIQSVENQFEGVKKEWKAKLEHIEAAIRLTAAKVANKSELRTVQCHWSFNWDQGVKMLFRGDTGEKITEEAIKDFEHQRHFDDLKKEQEKVQETQAVGDTPLSVSETAALPLSPGIMGELGDGPKVEG